MAFTISPVRMYNPYVFDVADLFLWLLKRVYNENKSGIVTQN